jgi:hypothetical protein
VSEARSGIFRICRTDVLGSQKTQQSSAQIDRAGLLREGLDQVTLDRSSRSGLVSGMTVA